MKIPSLVSLCLLSLLALNLSAIEEGDLKDDNGAHIVHYAVETPKTMADPSTTDPAKQLALFLCFHEHDGKAPDETYPVIEALKRLKLSEECVVIGMKDGTTHGYSPVEDHERALKLLAWAKKTYPINPRRVYLWGRGEGAKFVGEFGPEHPELISAIISYSWGFRKTFDIQNPELNVPDFYLVLGLKDLAHHLKWVRATYALAKEHGYPVIYREVEGLAGPTRFPFSNDDAILWAARTRHKTMPLSPAETALLQPYASEAAAHSCAPDPAVFTALTLVGGRQAGAILTPILESQDEKTRLMAAKACENANFGPDTIAALAKRIKDSSPAVRRAAIQALGVQANWRLLPAQDALCQVATDKTWDPAERALAIDAIGVGVKMQVRGFYQDPPLFRALVVLLDDDDAALRAKAFAILSPIPTSLYNPESEKDQRHPALDNWQQWLDHVTTKAAQATIAEKLSPKPK